MKLTIDENIAASMTHIDDYHELWTHIQKRFGVKNGQRVQRLKTELANCRQKGVVIEAYFGKLSQLWSNLADYQKAKTMEEVRKEREEDKLHQFLMGLDETLYGGVKSALLSRVPLPTLEEAYNMLIQDEESKLAGRQNEEKTDAVSFAVQTNSRLARSLNETRGAYENRACSNCGKKGHTSENCFRLIGYSEWYEERQKNRKGTYRGNQGALRISNSQSGTQNGRGRGAGRGSVQSNHVVAASASSLALTSADRVRLTGLNDDKWKTLVQMLNDRKAPPAEER